MILAAATVGGVSILHLLISFLVLVIVLAIIGGLLYCIETWVHPIPPPIKLVIAIILVILVIIWAVAQFAPGM